MHYNENRLSASERAEMRRQDRSYHLWRAGVLLVTAALLAWGVWGILNAGAMQTYWMYAVSVSLIPLAGFLLFGGFGWVLYGLGYSLMILFLAGAVAPAYELKFIKNKPDHQTPTVVNQGGDRSATT